jgi:MerR family transcriptional regulator, thiopeptide resistance regulator
LTPTYREALGWFYDYTSEIHVGLAELYVADPRFKTRYEAIAPGLAEFVRSAVTANAPR